MDYLGPCTILQTSSLGYLYKYNMNVNVYLFELRRNLAYNVSVRILKERICAARRRQELNLHAIVDIILLATGPYWVHTSPPARKAAHCPYKP